VSIFIETKSGDHGQEQVFFAAILSQMHKKYDDLAGLSILYPAKTGLFSSIWLGIAPEGKLFF
jgi:protein subunit release factor A